MFCLLFIKEVEVRIRIAAVTLALIIPLLLTSSCDKPTGAILNYTASDTTSHDFVWDETILGYNHTILEDVFAVSDTDVWVVGQITEWDAINRRLIIHNAAHWNGEEWKIYDIIFHEAPSTYGPCFIYSVFGFASDNVLFCAAHQVQRWNGKTFLLDESPSDLITGPVYGIWGSSDRDVWFVGGKGYEGSSFVVHYDGISYKSYNLGFTDDINDIWGVGDTALCVASDWAVASTQSKVLRLTHGRVEQAYEAGIEPSLKCIWYCKGMNPVATGGSNLQWDGKCWIPIPSFPVYWFRKGLRGTSPNDYFVISELAGIHHFNGVTWKKWTFGSEGRYHYSSLSCVENNVWVVGDNGGGIDRGLIIHGRRQGRINGRFGS